MNAKTAWVIYVIYAIIFAAVVWGFAHGAQMEETGPKVAWMVGSLAVAALGVFVAVKLNTRKRK
jgi:hypothetical protein